MRKNRLKVFAPKCLQGIFWGSGKMSSLPFLFYLSTFLILPPWLDVICVPARVQGRGSGGKDSFLRCVNQHKHPLGGW